MNDSERREWLGSLLDSQLCALCHVAGLYSISADWDRAKMISELSKIEGIEIPKETS